MSITSAYLDELTFVLAESDSGPCNEGTEAQWRILDETFVKKNFPRLRAVTFIISSPDEEDVVPTPPLDHSFLHANLPRLQAMGILRARNGSFEEVVR